MAWQKLTRKKLRQLHGDYFKNIDNRYQAFDVSPKENLPKEAIEFYDEHLKKLGHDFKDDYYKYKYATDFYRYLQNYMAMSNQRIISQKDKDK